MLRFAAYELREPRPGRSPRARTLRRHDGSRFLKPFNKKLLPCARSPLPQYFTFIQFGARFYLMNEVAYH